MTQERAEYNAGNALAIYDEQAIEQMAQRINNYQVLAKWPEKLGMDMLRLMAEQAISLDLNPMLGELYWVKGRLYISKAGLLKIAHEEGTLDGIEPTPLTDDERKMMRIADNQHAWRAVVWKKGCGHPFVEYGVAGPGNCQNPDHMAMAIKRAVHHALREAYSPRVAGLALEGDEDLIEAANGVQRVEVRPAPPRQLSAGKKVTPPPAEIVTFEEAATAGKRQMLIIEYLRPYAAGKQLEQMSEDEFALVRKSALADLNLDRIDLQLDPIAGSDELTDEGEIVLLWQHKTQTMRMQADPLTGEVIEAADTNIG